MYVHILPGVSDSSLVLIRLKYFFLFQFHLILQEGLSKPPDVDTGLRMISELDFGHMNLPSL